MMVFNYCPQCGKELVLKEIGDEGLMPYCTPCLKVYFDWIGQCTITGVVNEFDEIALLRQNGSPADRWGLVAGHMKKGESLELSALREVEEETGQISNEITYVSSYYYEQKELLMVGFKCRVNKRAFSASKEIEEVKWFTLEEADQKIRHGSIAYQLYDQIRKDINA